GVPDSSADDQMRVPSQQRLLCAIEAIDREVRLARVCMNPATAQPLTPEYAPISGTHGTTDTITIISNPACAGPANITADCNACASITIASVGNFTAGKWAYAYDGDGTETPPGPTGEYFWIQY